MHQSNTSAVHLTGRQKVGRFVSRTVLLWPALALLMIFFVWPIFMALYYSFTNLALSGAAAKNLQFVGLDNYRKLFSDASMFRSVKNTLVFLVGSIVGQNLLGFMMAYFMKRRNHIVRRIVGSCILGGWVMPEIVVAICMYAFFYSKGTGTLNRIITLFGGSPVPWLFSHAMLVVILANIWHGMAYSMMVYQAALDDVPEDIEESAYMDGATRLQNLRYIIIPHVKSTIYTNTMLITLMTLGVFGLIYAMTGGGPSGATQTLPIYMYVQAFKSFQLGYGTAISIVLLMIGIALSVLYTRIAKDH
ncbi:MAG: sugar ABC transporter permease [Eubacteriales bacterium]|nr:sugar ABC transporter permease [Eubacteriales bacterium]